MDGLTLPAELADFATEAVAAGRYRDTNDVIAAGVKLVRKLEADRAAFIASLEAAQAEGDCDGFSEIDDLAEELDAIIAEEERARA